ncbi:MAG TPA: cytochrome c biogenesis protein CcdA [archaeon]|nr:cytochrome c biogenesis protein CcdA [archaeon]
MIGLRLRVFSNAVVFVIGFSLVFALFGVLLNTALSGLAFDARVWAARIGGVVIVLFGLYLTGILKLGFLERRRGLKARRFRNTYATSFVFGASFAVGWTPCVGAILGAILTLAATQPGTSFALLLLYSLGLGVPFLIAGAFTAQLASFIQRSQRAIKWVSVVAGILLIGIGALVFLNQLQVVASFLFPVTGAPIDDSALPLTGLTAFGLGLLSFLSPCILPLVPGFITYISGVSAAELTSQRAPATATKVR